MFEHSGSDAQTMLVTKLKLRLDKHSSQITQAIGYYNQTNVFMDNVVKAEGLLHKIVYAGFKTSGVKRILLKRFKIRNETDAGMQDVEDKLFKLHTDLDDDELRPKSDGSQYLDSDDSMKKFKEMRNLEFN